MVSGFLERSVGPPGPVSPGKRTSGWTSSLVLTGRLLLLLLAAAATVSGFALSRDHAAAETGSQHRYVCPMHPEVTSSTAGECPICRMALEQVPSSRQVQNGAPPSALQPSSEAAVDPAQLSLEQSSNPKNYKVVDTAKRRVFAQEVRAPASSESGGFVVAMLYKDELTGLSPDEPGLFFRARAPDLGVPVRRTGEAPGVWDGSTSRVQFRPTAGIELAVGEVGWLKLDAKPRELLVVPASAVVYSSQGPHVLVAGSDGHCFFRKRRVEIGKTFRGLAVVLSGLQEAESVAVAGTFFLDAERRRQPAQGEAIEAAP